MKFRGPNMVLRGGKMDLRQGFQPPLLQTRVPVHTLLEPSGGPEGSRGELCGLMEADYRTAPGGSLPMPCQLHLRLSRHRAWSASAGGLALGFGRSTRLTLIAGLLPRGQCSADPLQTCSSCRS